MASKGVMVSTEFRFFMCIGAPRSGTTWLYVQLRNHPEIFLPPIKEVKHFGSERRGHVARRKAVELRKRDPDLSEADLRWLQEWEPAGRDDDAAYVRLMRMRDASIAGDITPVYSAMKSEQIAHVRDVLGPNVRVLYVLRNPIERDWSHLAFVLHGQHKKKEVSLEDYLRFIDQARMRRRSDYCRVIKNWRDVFENVKVVFHDQIKTNAQGFLDDVSGFLGVSPRLALDEERKVNRSKKVKMPPVLGQYLAERHLPMMMELAREYPDPVAAWIKKAERLLDEPRDPLPENLRAPKRRRSIWAAPRRKKVKPAERTLFLGIGPPKTGTSWLHGYLTQHAEVFMSPVKGLEYFSVRHLPDRYGQRNEIFRRRVKESQEKYDAEPKPFRGLVLAAMKARVAMIDDPPAYMGYFADSAGPYHKVVGEISPTYIELEEDGFQAIRAMWTKVRLLCTLRDPVDRLWSEMRSRKQRREQFDPIAAFERELRKPPPLPDRTLAMLGAMFNEQEFRVEFYETLFTEETIRGICKWLGVKYEAPDFSQKVRPGPVIPLPADLEARARAHFAPLYDDYKARFGDRLPKSWRL